MNTNRIGREIEACISGIDGFSDSKMGFDMVYGDTEIEVKGCCKLHKNGCNRGLKPTFTKGRFWICNRSHKLLVEEKGKYIFVLYKIINKEIKWLNTKVINASLITKRIKTGDNTKIRYDLIFTEYLKR